MSELLVANDIRVQANGRSILRGIDLQVRTGERVLLMGPNGAGKSQLLRVLHGLVSPQTGHVLWNGDVMNAKARSEQAMVFQRPILMRRSVIGNLLFALRARGVRGDAARSRALEVLGLAGLDALAAHPARKLSGGEQQRLALAMALAGQPRLVFLDEPTANLDPAATHAVEQMLNASLAQNVAQVFVTHDLGQARRLGGRLIFLEAGQVAESGPVAECLAEPRSAALDNWMNGRLSIPQPDGV